MTHRDSGGMAARLLRPVVTEGLGRQKFHGRIVVLVNEHTSGAGEMVAGFAKENKLATIVGNRTAGRLLGGEGFKVGAGYIAFLPVGCYLSWGGHRFEGSEPRGNHCAHGAAVAGSA